MRLSKFKMDGQTIDVIDNQARKGVQKNADEIDNVNARVTEAYHGINDTRVKLQEETNRATAAENDLLQKVNENTNNITAETERATSEEETIKQSVQTNSDSIKQNSDNIHNATTAIEKEVERATNSENELVEKVNVNADNISTEKNARISADNVINQKVETKADKADTVSNVTVTNENGIYTLSQTKDGNTTEIGTIKSGTSSNNPVVEVKDSVVENTTDNYDFHTLTETTEDGTENEIGKFYLGNSQLIGLLFQLLFEYNDPVIKMNCDTVDQTGKKAQDIYNVAKFSKKISSTGGYGIDNVIYELIVNSSLTNLFSLPNKIAANIGIVDGNKLQVFSFQPYGQANVASGIAEKIEYPIEPTRIRMRTAIKNSTTFTEAHKAGDIIYLDSIDLTLADGFKPFIHDGSVPYNITFMTTNTSKCSILNANSPLQILAIDDNTLNIKGLLLRFNEDVTTDDVYSLSASIIEGYGYFAS